MLTKFLKLFSILVGLVWTSVNGFVEELFMSFKGFKIGISLDHTQMYLKEFVVNIPAQLGNSMHHEKLTFSIYGVLK